MPYFHFAMHLDVIFECFGPAYVWCIFAYECTNGLLAKYKHNGHTGGELEVTLMQGWWKVQLIQDPCKCQFFESIIRFSKYV